MVPNWNAPSSSGSSSASDGSMGSMHFSSSGAAVGVVTTATGGVSVMNGDNNKFKLKIQQVNLRDPPGKEAVTCREFQYHSNLHKNNSEN